MTDDGSPEASDGAPAAGVDERSRELRLSVPGMDCASCVSKIDRSVRGLDGIEDVDARLSSGTLAVRYDPGRSDEDAIRSRVEAAGYAIADGGEETVTIEVPSMDCSSCASTVERALADRDGVLGVETRPAAGRVVVRYDGARIDRPTVVAAIENAGYRVVEAGTEAPTIHEIWTGRRAILTWIGAVLLLGGLAFQFLVTGLNAPVVELLGRVYLRSDVLYVLGAAIAGTPVLRAGLRSARARSLDIDLLMSAGILGAIGAHHPFEAATLAVLFSTAELLERFSMERARASLRSLLELSPETATVRRDGEERVVPVESVRVGDVVLVRPGEKVPMDGRVHEGHSAVDQSPITGESVPVEKAPGDEVFAGTFNEEGYLEVEVTSDAGDSTIDRIVEAVEEAEASKTERERFVDRFARVYTPLVVVGAIATATVPPLALGASWDVWFLRGLTLLVIACPCAFVISTPVSVVSGITSAARNGVLIKGGAHLEAMGEVAVVAMDKTGTLTTGRLAVTEVIPLNGNGEGDVLRCAWALERRSEHPIARAIVEAAEDEGIGVEEPTVVGFENVPGEGVTGELDGTRHYVGKPAMFADLGFDLGHVHPTTDGGIQATTEAGPRENCDREDCLDVAVEVVPRLEREGRSVVLVGTADELEGVIAIADRVRPEAAQAVRRLHEAGVERVVMLTGDNEGTARAIAERVGIDDYRADLLPEDKLEAIRSLEAEYGPVAMVGDGVNDAPALATATVGVAMGAAGTDTAIETADIALMGDDLGRLAYLVRLARTANRVIRQNIWSSLGVKAVLAVGAPLGLVTIIHAVLIGDMGMSLTVTGNAMRLARVDPRVGVGDEVEVGVEVGAEAEAGSGGDGRAGSALDPPTRRDPR